MADPASSANESQVLPEGTEGIASGAAVPGSSAAKEAAKAALTGAIVASLASGLLYLSVYVSFAFLIPIQLATSRFGRKSGWIASVLALCVITIGSGARALSIGPLGIGELAMAALPPAALLLALGFVNAAFWEGRWLSIRLLGASVALALAAFPALNGLWKDADLNAYIVGRLDAVFAPLREQAALTGGFDAAALAATIDAAALAATAKEALLSSILAIILALLGGSWWLGSSLSRSGEGVQKAPPLPDVRIPQVLVWPFLAAWASVLATMVFKAAILLRSVAWNCALAMSVVYAAQGLGIIAHFFKRWNLPRSLRIAAVAVAILSAPMAGSAIGIALPLLGVTEVWIPYRNLKGAGA
jgi:hypothetical protein